ncbi:hypothetical protein Tco_0033849 [Tanacetum coccineum]
MQNQLDGLQNQLTNLTDMLSRFVASNTASTLGSGTLPDQSEALIDVYEGEITLLVGKEAITFNLDQTSRYTANYNYMTANRIDVIELACEEYSQEVLGFSDVLNAFIAIDDEANFTEIDAITDDPRVTFLSSKQLLYESLYLLFRIIKIIRTKSVEELKVVEAKTIKSSIDEPPEVELKDLPPHLEYTFLEGDDKLPAKLRRLKG